MVDLSGKTAVVTGGASGVGYCLCDVFLGRGMRVVIADIEAPALERALGMLQKAGHDRKRMLGVQTDVTSAASVAALADRTYRHFGGVHILCNNAGVGIKEAQRRLWTLTEHDWEWGYQVNVMGP